MGKLTFDFKSLSDMCAAMAVGPEVSGIGLAIVEKGKTIAEGLSADFAVTGEYESSFVTSVAVQQLPGDRGGVPHKAAVAKLENTSDHAIAVEYGYAGRADEEGKKAHRVLGRTLAALETR